LQALILAGGEGTRLRPLTSTIPKPVVPLVDRPFIAYTLEWLSGHGVDDVILSCGFMAEGMRGVLGARSAHGMRLRYLEEPEPLGTGGALKFAHGLLDERFLMLNGDILTDFNLSGLLAQHERTAARATLALVAVEDPSAYGMVRCNADRSVREFVEKPSPEQIDTNLISAGVYVLEREVLDTMAPAGTNISIEREVFPELVGTGLFGYASDAYLLDIGTPERYLQATFDILEGKLDTALRRRMRDAGLALVEGDPLRLLGQIVAPAFVAADCLVAQDAIVGGRAVLARGVHVQAGASVESSVLLQGASVGIGSTVSSSIVGPDAQIGDRCRIERGVVLGAGVKVGAGNVLSGGARIFPGVELPEGAIGF